MSDTISQETLGIPSNVAAQIEQKRAGRRQRVYHGKTLCSGCYAEPPLPNQRYGRECQKKAKRESYRRKAAELKRLRNLTKTAEQA